MSIEVRSPLLGSDPLADLILAAGPALRRWAVHHGAHTALDLAAEMRALAAAPAADVDASFGPTEDPEGDARALAAADASAAGRARAPQVTFLGPLDHFAGVDGFDEGSLRHLAYA